MSTKDDQKTPVGETPTPEETPTQDSTPETPETPSSDPLDEMDDGQMRAFALAKDWNIEDSLEGGDLRAKLKERRSISQRHASKPQDDKPSDDGDVVRRSDLETTREQEARESLEETDDAVLADIRDNWSEIAEYYNPRNGRATAKAILKDMRIARAAYREANPATDDTSSDATRDVAAVRGKGGTSPKPTDAPKKSILPKRQGIDKWYPTED